MKVVTGEIQNPSLYYIVTMVTREVAKVICHYSAVDLGGVLGWGDTVLPLGGEDEGEEKPLLA